MYYGWSNWPWKTVFVFFLLQSCTILMYSPGTTAKIRKKDLKIGVIRIKYTLTLPFNYHKAHYYCIIRAINIMRAQIHVWVGLLTRRTNHCVSQTSWNGHNLFCLIAFSECRKWTSLRDHESYWPKWEPKGCLKLNSVCFWICIWYFQMQAGLKLAQLRVSIAVRLLGGTMSSINDKYYPLRHVAKPVTLFWGKWLPTPPRILQCPNFSRA